jgi:hypothetical protein
VYTYLLVEELAVHGPVHREQVVIGGDGALHLDVQAAHGGAELARGAPHLLGGRGLGQRAGDHLEDAGLFT